MNYTDKEIEISKQRAYDKGLIRGVLYVILICIGFSMLIIYNSIQSGGGIGRRRRRSGEMNAIQAHNVQQVTGSNPVLTTEGANPETLKDKVG